jgi:hypothetical protein
MAAAVRVAAHLLRQSQVARRQQLSRVQIVAIQLQQARSSVTTAVTKFHRA